MSWNLTQSAAGLLSTENHQHCEKYCAVFSQASLRALSLVASRGKWQKRELLCDAIQCLLESKPQSVQCNILPGTWVEENSRVSSGVQCRSLRERGRNRGMRGKLGDRREAKGIRPWGVSCVSRNYIELSHLWFYLLSQISDQAIWKGQWVPRCSVSHATSVWDAKYTNGFELTEHFFSCRSLVRVKWCSVID